MAAARFGCSAALLARAPVIGTIFDAPMLFREFCAEYVREMNRARGSRGASGTSWRRPRTGAAGGAGGELGLDSKKAAPGEEAACSVKVVAGACNTFYLLLFATTRIGWR